ncbi:hypothetical protein BASA81_004452 [Batrachochytrium salamandrivorans]|nr:hypothetical protein BASA81_004452 [Batrachochytrium salamandrivorans]
MPDSRLILGLDGVTCGVIAFGVIAGYGLFWEPLRIAAFDLLSTRKIIKYKNIELYFEKQESFAKDVKVLGDMSSRQCGLRNHEMRDTLSNIRRSIFFNEQYRPQYENLWYATQHDDTVQHKCEDLKNNLARLKVAAMYECKDGDVRNMSQLVREFDNKLASAATRQIYI